MEGRNRNRVSSVLPKPKKDPNQASVYPGLLSVIIPMYHEEKTIGKLIGTLVPLVRGGAEILFCDGGSSDRTLEILNQMLPELSACGHEAWKKRTAEGRKNKVAEGRKNKVPPQIQVFTSSQKGRAWQMNEAADRSHGSVLFFLHCDSEVPGDAAEEIARVLKHFSAGCFGIDFREKKNFFMYTCKWISNHRVKDRRVMFGDQGIFLRRELFYRIGAYPELPIMEDYQLSLNLKAAGIRFGMTKHRIYTSPRRFQGNTFRKLHVMWQMNRLRAAYRRGVPIEEIAAKYRDIR